MTDTPNAIPAIMTNTTANDALPLAPGQGNSRNLVICLDGTSNEFGPSLTNVLRLAQILEHDPTGQLVHYVPGVGTMPGPGFATWIGQKISLVSGLAFGTGLNEIVESAYSYLMDVWEPGDRIFIFGFSRGAYAARVLAAMLHAIGLLPKGNQNLVPYAMRLFRSVRKRQSWGTSDEEDANEGDAKWNYWKLVSQFRKTFARRFPMPKQPENRRCPVHFLGVWDTVSSVGWVWEPATFPYTASNPSVKHVRHAVAIDERRWFFRQNLFHPLDGQDVRELWFAGSHGDVGGGYPEPGGGLSQVSFHWMVDESTALGLTVNAGWLMTRRQTAATAPVWRLPQHESLTWKWWPAEFFPKWQWRPELKRKVLRMGLGRHRRIPDGAKFHDSVSLRIRDVSYRLPNLSLDESVPRTRECHPTGD